MGDADVMYDDEQEAACRFVGFLGQQAQHDLVLLNTDRFFGKTLVAYLQTNRLAVLSAQEAEDAEYLAVAFDVSQADAVELAAFLSANL